MDTSVLNEILDDGTEPVAVFLLTPDHDTSPFATYEPLQHQLLPGE